MTTIDTVILIAHVLIAMSIIGLVMLQKGKGADAGAGFGAGASGTVFGARGSANFLSRSTAVLATLFFATSMGLAYLNRNVDIAPSLLEQAVVQEQLPVGDAVSVQPASPDELLELPTLPTLPVQENQPDSTSAPQTDKGVAPDATN
jgi:preprotein translocase subunit SecG